jgi:hypothetical protein
MKPPRHPERAAAHRRLLAATLATGLVAISIAAVGCNGILGIDERTLAKEEGGLSCQAYCDTIQATCTAEFQEYQTPEACLSTCGQIPLGAESDTSGDTVGCRMHNVQLAKDTGELGDYCPISGPVGGGSCGDRCENFCTLFVPTCAAYTAITDQASCLTFCQTSPDNAVWDPQDPNQKDHDASIQCRIWHLANAVLDPTLHCGHAAGTTKCEGSGGGTTSSSVATGAGGAGGAGGGNDG